MANIEASLVSLLLSYSSVSDLIGTRIYPVMMTQGATMPAIVYNRINTYGEHANQTTATLITSRFRFDCYANTMIEAQDLASKVKTSLDAFIGTILSVPIEGILYADEFDGYDEDSDLAVVGVDFKVMHRL